MGGSTNNYPLSSSSSAASAGLSLGLNDSTTSNTDPTLPSTSDLQKIVTAYFERKGYTPADMALLRDVKGNTMTMEQLVQYIRTNHSKNNGSNNTSTCFSVPLLQHLLNTNGDNDDLLGDPDAYTTSYIQLREWVENALDLYKSDLSTLLYPIFVHIYLDLVSNELLEQAAYFIKKFGSDHINIHESQEVEQLGNINTPQQVAENPLSQKYRNNKYRITMFRIPYELFLDFIKENKRSNLLRIVNQYLSIEVTHEKSAGGANDYQNGFGIMDRETESSTVDNLKKEDDFMEIDGTGPFGGTLKHVKQEVLPDSPVLGDISASHLPSQSVDIQMELDTLNDLRKRISHGSVSLPSVCAYTFHNTHDGLNCIEISDDASLIAGGFSESFVKIWSLNGDPLRKTNKDNGDGEDKEQTTDYVKLIGHAGAVYGASFNHDNEYLISCSQDQTARLWSTRTFENLVVYKSHNYPVWDVDFGPFGFYFATASHDKTARLWSCDRIHPLRIFAGHLSDVDVVKFHPNSKYLVTGSSDRTARLWDVQRGSCVRVFTGHTGAVKTVAISPNGRIMASAGEDKTINLWDLGSGRRLKTMTGHTDYIYAMDFSTDSHTLVSGGADGTVRVWDVNAPSGPTTSNSTTTTTKTASTSSTSSSSVSSSTTRSNDMKRIRLEEAARKEKNDNNKADDHRHPSNSILESSNHLAVFPTKQTPIYTVQFTKRNLCLVAGAFNP
ncbi:WD40-repeat-containing domain protein [Halteromyces radiatus]|uniref:WD40-repeat-containing domain protein n=1 Tax=Halteromyces radiatus TaxID=101107 RepID=UPI002220D34A|nr:WD40-repeat-containing domain protein [Halteromyces radiatus]KAI8099622.1 WD40-repeat-containing domain protein [Halteromyces radiatus]